MLHGALDDCCGASASNQPECCRSHGTVALALVSAVIAGVTSPPADSAVWFGSVSTVSRFDRPPVPPPRQ
jgi:hypothetical protein